MYLPLRQNLQRLVQSASSRLPNVVKAGLSIGGISLAMTLMVGGLGRFLEAGELRSYDWMLRHRVTRSLDSRILVVGIDEMDLQALHRVTPDDETLAKALAEIQRLGPRVVGLDLYRDLPQAPGRKALDRQLAMPNLIAITRLGRGVDERVPAPDVVTAERVGFNNLVIDNDGVVRRNLLVAQDYPSFGLLTALQYLEKDGIGSQPSGLNPDWIKLGETDLMPLNPAKVGTEGYQILLDYRTMGPIARKVSLRQVLRGEVPADWVRDKIVLIGNTATGGKDFFYTPYSAIQEQHHQISGVELHGQMISQLLDTAQGQRQLIRVLPEWVVWGMMGVGSFVGGVLVWRSQHPVRLLLWSGGLLGGIVGLCTLGMMANYWLPVLSPVTTTMLTLGMVMAYRANRDQTQRRMMMILLGQNTSKEIAQALWQNRDQLVQSGKLPGQGLRATMMFTDLQGFSTISERLEPAALMNWLNEYLDVMTEVIHQHDGLVNKFTGDGVFAVFGVPIAREDELAIARDAMNAVACAVEMEVQLGILNEQWISEGLGMVRMRVGICTGDVVVGSLGGKDRMEYGIIGDPVNIASRLESCAKERHEELCRILISEETYAALGSGFAVESWGDMALKGKQQLVGTYRVLR